MDSSHDHCDQSPSYEQKPFFELALQVALAERLQRETETSHENVRRESCTVTRPAVLLQDGAGCSNVNITNNNGSAQHITANEGKYVTPTHLHNRENCENSSTMNMQELNELSPSKYSTRTYINVDHQHYEGSLTNNFRLNDSCAINQDGDDIDIHTDNDSEDSGDFVNVKERKHNNECKTIKPCISKPCQTKHLLKRRAVRRKRCIDRGLTSKRFLKRTKGALSLGSRWRIRKRREESDESGWESMTDSEVMANNRQAAQMKEREGLKAGEEFPEIRIPMKRQLERTIAEGSAKNKLSVSNVKVILRSLITNDLVKNMLMSTLRGPAEEPLEGLVVYEPKLTRSRFKEVLQTDQDPKLWPISPIKLGQPATTGPSILDVEFPEEEDDAEYEPTRDLEDADSDDESLTSSQVSERGSPFPFGSPPSSLWPPSNPTTPRTPGLLLSPTLPTHLSTPVTDRASSTASALLLSQRESQSELARSSMGPPLAPVTANSTKKRLEFTSADAEDDGIARRTRSKLPLTTTSLNDIEEAFVAPDITPDMYDTLCDNTDWQDFLKSLHQFEGGDIQNESTEMGEEDDPEFNYLAEAEKEEIEAEEELYQAPFRVSRKELNCLMEELEDLFDDDYTMIDTRTHYHSPSAHTAASKKTPDTDDEQEESASPRKGARRRKPFGKQSRPSVPVESAEGGSHQCMILDHQIRQIHQQMRQHIQLTTQMYILAQDSEGFTSVAEDCKSIVKEISMLQRATIAGPSSAFNACNLAGAVEIMDSDIDWASHRQQRAVEEKEIIAQFQGLSEGEGEDSTEASTSGESDDFNSRKKAGRSSRVKKVYAGLFRKVLLVVQQEVMWGSAVFLYPSLLPTLSLVPKAAVAHLPVRQDFSQHEVMLLILGMEQFQHLGRDDCYHLIQKHLIPVKTTAHIKNYFKNITSNKSSVLWKYKIKGEVPEFPRDVEDFSPDMVKAPCDQPVFLLPNWCRILKKRMDVAERKKEREEKFQRRMEESKKRAAEKKHQREQMERSRREVMRKDKCSQLMDAISRLSRQRHCFMPKNISLRTEVGEEAAGSQCEADSGLQDPSSSEPPAKRPRLDPRPASDRSQHPNGEQSTSNRSSPQASSSSCPPDKPSLIITPTSVFVPLHLADSSKVSAAVASSRLPAAQLKEHGFHSAVEGLRSAEQSGQTVGERADTCSQEADGGSALEEPHGRVQSTESAVSGTTERTVESLEKNLPPPHQAASLYNQCLNQVLFVTPPSEEFSSPQQSEETLEPVSEPTPPPPEQVGIGDEVGRQSSTEAAAACKTTVAETHVVKRKSELEALSSELSPLSSEALQSLMHTLVSSDVHSELSLTVHQAFVTSQLDPDSPNFSHSSRERENPQPETVTTLVEISEETSTAPVLSSRHHAFQRAIINKSMEDYSEALNTYSWSSPVPTETHAADGKIIDLTVTGSDSVRDHVLCESETDQGCGFNVEKVKDHKSANSETSPKQVSVESLMELSTAGSDVAAGVILVESSTAGEERPIKECSVVVNEHSPEQSDFGKRQNLSNVAEQVPNDSCSSRDSTPSVIDKPTENVSRDKPTPPSQNSAENSASAPEGRLNKSRITSSEMNVAESRDLTKITSTDYSALYVEPESASRVLPLEQHVEQGRSPASLGHSAAESPAGEQSETQGRSPCVKPNSTTTVPVEQSGAQHSSLSVERDSEKDGSPSVDLHAEEYKSANVEHSTTEHTSPSVMEDRPLSVEHRAVEDRSPSLQHRAVEDRSPSLQHRAVEDRSPSLQHRAVEDRSPSLQHRAVEDRSPSLQHRAVEDRSPSLQHRAVEDRSPSLQHRAVEHRSPSVDHSAVQDGSTSVEQDAWKDSSQLAEQNAVVYTSRFVDQNLVEGRSPSMEQNAMEKRSPYVVQNSIEERSPSVEHSSIEERSSPVEHNSANDRSSPVEHNSANDRSSPVEHNSVNDRSSPVEHSSANDRSLPVEHNSGNDRSPSVDQNEREERSTSVEHNTVGESFPLSVGHNLDETCLSAEQNATGERSQSVEHSTEDGSSSVEPRAADNKSLSVEQTTAEDKSPSVKQTTAEDKSPSVKQTTAEDKSPSVEQTTAEDKSPSVKQTTAEDKSPSVEQTAAEDKSPSVKQTTAEDKSPSVEQTAAEDKSPSVKQTTAEDKSPSVEQTTAEDKSPSVKQTTAEDKSPSVEQTAAEDKSPSVKQTTAEDKSPSVEQTTAEDKSPSVKQTTAEDKSPSVEQTTAEDKSPSVKQTTAEDKSPSVKQTTAEDKSPSVEQTAADNKSLSVEQTAAEDKSPSVEQTTAEDKSPSVEQTAADNKSLSVEQTAAEDKSPSVEQTAAEDKTLSSVEQDRREGRLPRRMETRPIWAVPAEEAAVTSALVVKFECELEVESPSSTTPGLEDQDVHLHRGRTTGCLQATTPVNTLSTAVCDDSVSSTSDIGESSDPVKPPPCDTVSEPHGNSEQSSFTPCDDAAERLNPAEQVHTIPTVVEEERALTSVKTAPTSEVSQSSLVTQVSSVPAPQRDRENGEEEQPSECEQREHSKPQGLPNQIEQHEQQRQHEQEKQPTNQNSQDEQQTLNENGQTFQNEPDEIIQTFGKENELGIHNEQNDQANRTEPNEHGEQSPWVASEDKSWKSDLPSTDQICTCNPGLGLQVKFEDMSGERMMQPSTAERVLLVRLSAPWSIHREGQAQRGGPSHTHVEESNPRITENKKQVQTSAKKQGRQCTQKRPSQLPLNSEDCSHSDIERVGQSDSQTKKPSLRQARSKKKVVSAHQTPESLLCDHMFSSGDHSSREDQAPKVGPSDNAEVEKSSLKKTENTESQAVCSHKTSAPFLREFLLGSQHHSHSEAHRAGPSDSQAEKPSLRQTKNTKSPCPSSQDHSHREGQRVGPGDTKTWGSHLTRAHSKNFVLSNKSQATFLSQLPSSLDLLTDSSQKDGTESVMLEDTLSQSQSAHVMFVDQEPGELSTLRDPQVSKASQSETFAVNPSRNIGLQCPSVKGAQEREIGKSQGPPKKRLHASRSNKSQDFSLKQSANKMCESQISPLKRPCASKTSSSRDSPMKRPHASDTCTSPECPVKRPRDSKTSKPSSSSAKRPTSPIKSPSASQTSKAKKSPVKSPSPKKNSKAQNSPKKSPSPNRNDKSQHSPVKKSCAMKSQDSLMKNSHACRSRQSEESPVKIPSASKSSKSQVSSMNLPSASETDKSQNSPVKNPHASKFGKPEMALMSHPPASETGKSRNLPLKNSCRSKKSQDSTMKSQSKTSKSHVSSVNHPSPVKSPRASKTSKSHVSSVNHPSPVKSPRASKTSKSHVSSVNHPSPVKSPRASKTSKSHVSSVNHPSPVKSPRASKTSKSHVSSVNHPSPVKSPRASKTSKSHVSSVNHPSPVKSPRASKTSKSHDSARDICKSQLSPLKQPCVRKTRKSGDSPLKSPHYASKNSTSQHSPVKNQSAIETSRSQKNSGSAPEAATSLTSLVESAQLETTRNSQDVAVEGSCESQTRRAHPPCAKSSRSQGIVRTSSMTTSSHQTVDNSAEPRGTGTSVTPYSVSCVQDSSLGVSTNPQESNVRACCEVVSEQPVSGHSSTSPIACVANHSSTSPVACVANHISTSPVACVANHISISPVACVANHSSTLPVACVANHISTSPVACVANHISISPVACVANHISTLPVACVANHISISPVACVANHISTSPVASVANHISTSPVANHISTSPVANHTSSSPVASVANHISSSPVACVANHSSTSPVACVPGASLPLSPRTTSSPHEALASNSTIEVCRSPIRSTSAGNCLSDENGSSVVTVFPVLTLCACEDSEATISSISQPLQVEGSSDAYSKEKEEAGSSSKACLEEKDDFEVPCMQDLQAMSGESNSDVSISVREGGSVPSNRTAVTSTTTTDVCCLSVVNTGTSRDGFFGEGSLPFSSVSTMTVVPSEQTEGGRDETRTEKGSVIDNHDRDGSLTVINTVQPACFESAPGKTQLSGAGCRVSTSPQESRRVSSGKTVSAKDVNTTATPFLSPVSASPQETMCVSSGKNVSAKDATPFLCPSRPVRRRLHQSWSTPSSVGDTTDSMVLYITVTGQSQESSNSRSEKPDLGSPSFAQASLAPPVQNDEDVCVQSDVGGANVPPNRPAVTPTTDVHHSSVMMAGTGSDVCAEEVTEAGLSSTMNNAGVISTNKASKYSQVRGGGFRVPAPKTCSLSTDGSSSLEPDVGASVPCTKQNMTLTVNRPVVSTSDATRSSLLMDSTGKEGESACSADHGAVTVSDLVLSVPALPENLLHLNKEKDSLVYIVEKDHHTSAHGVPHGLDSTEENCGPPSISSPVKWARQGNFANLLQRSGSSASGADGALQVGSVTLQSSSSSQKMSSGEEAGTSRASTASEEGRSVSRAVSAPLMSDETMNALFDQMRERGAQSCASVTFGFLGTFSSETQDVAEIPQGAEVRDARSNNREPAYCSEDDITDRRSITTEPAYCPEDDITDRRSITTEPAYCPEDEVPDRAAQEAATVPPSSSTQSSNNSQSAADTTVHQQGEGSAEDITWTEEQDRVILEMLRDQGDTPETYVNITTTLQTVTADQVSERVSALLELLESYEEESTSSADEDV